MNQRIQEKLHTASAAYEVGYTCAQAVFLAYADELGIPQEKALRLTEGLGNGIGGADGLCGVIAAASLIVGYYSSDGTPCDCSQSASCKDAVRIKGIFEKEFGGSTCRSILLGQAPTSGCCVLRIKDMVLVIEQLLMDVRRDSA